MEMHQQSTGFFSAKVVIITGSSKGIGLAIAKQLGLQGAHLVINGRNENDLLAAAKILLDEGYSCLPIIADVRDEQQCNQMVQKVVATFGRIDVIFANAGLSAKSTFEASSPALYRNLMEVNFIGPINIIHACLPYLKINKGHILVTGSIIGLFGIPGFSAYAASKMALTALVQSMRIELNASGMYIGLAYVGITQNDPGKLSLAPDGISSMPTQQEERPGKHQTQEEVARQMIRMIESRRPYKFFSTLGKLNYWMLRLAPGLVHVLFSNYYKKKTISKSR